MQVESGRYDNKDDFVVVYQPTNLNSHFPKLPLNKRHLKVDPHDYSFVAIDCIHYTQKLHARSEYLRHLLYNFLNEISKITDATGVIRFSVANVYWNNLFEDPGNKTTDWEMPAYSKFLCPTEKKPYLLTKKNYFIDFSKPS